MQHVPFSRVAKVLKSVMKKNEVGYKEMAFKLKMSESGFKKIMASNDCSLGKLSAICEVLNVPPHAILKEASVENSFPTPLTASQKKLLNSDVNLPRILNCLQMMDYDLKEVCRVFKVKKEKIYPYLRRLEGAKLIRWEEKDKIKSFAPLYYDFKGVPSSSRDAKNMRSDIIRKSGGADIEATAPWACRTLNVNPIRRELLDEMNSKVKKLIEDYMWQNVREWEIYPKKDMITAAWVYSCFPYTSEEHFGKIE